jgi:hypothetical protein
MEFTASKRVGEQGTGEQEISFFALVYFLYKQDLRKSTFKTPYIGLNGIRSHAHVVPVGKS